MTPIDAVSVSTSSDRPRHPQRPVTHSRCASVCSPVNHLVGLSHGHLPQAGVLYVSNMEEPARAFGCARIESHHRATNNAVLIAKLRAGYVIVGTEFTGEMGLLVKLSKQLLPQRDAMFHARAGALVSHSEKPAQREVLEQPEHHRQHKAEQPEHENAAPHLRDLVAALDINDGRAQAVKRCEHFADHHSTMPMDRPSRMPTMIWGDAAGRMKCHSRAAPLIW